MKFFILITVLCGNILFLSAKEVVKTVIFPFKEAVISAMNDSVLESWPFKIGESFKKDDVIAKLNDRNFVLKLRQAQQQMNYMRAVYQDKKELRKRNFTSDFEVKKAEYEFKQAESDFALAELNYSYCQIKAPFSGKVVEFMTQEFETVRRGQPLVRIIDDNFLFAVMNIPQKQRPKLDSEMKILLDNGMTVAGKVYEISPRADHRTGTVRVRVLINNSKGKLCAGMTGELVNGK